MPLAPPLYLKKPRLAFASAQGTHIPPPIGGLNTIDPGYDMPPTDCPLLYNMIGAENGLRSRLGYKEWCTGLGSGLVPTIVPYQGSSSTGSQDRLFATTSTGIYDVTSSGTTTLTLSFASNAANAGWGVSHAVVNQAGGHFLLLCDEQNGYHVYTEATDTWAAVTTGIGTGKISGVDPTALCFATVWKNFVLFVEKDSTRMWFGSTTNSPFGTVTSFDVGSKFKHGGNLVGLWSWTVDGGEGVDDYLVAVGSGGDVVLYQGTDPNSANTFGLTGVWFVGGLPAGRRIATDHGGDLLLLSSIGVIPMSKLINGVSIMDRSQYATQKIGNLFNRAVSTFGTQLGWSLRIQPEDAALVITLPESDGKWPQLAMSLLTRGWSQYRDLPMVANETWGAKLYFGTDDGRVCVNTGYLDNVSISDPNSFSSVQCSGITAFRNLGNARQKQIKLIRPTVISEGGVAVSTEARYRYDLTEAGSVTLAGSADTNTWDVGLWDVAQWGGEFTTQQNPTGASGMGPDAAIAFRIAATSRTVLTGIDVIYTEGGIL